MIGEFNSNDFYCVEHKSINEMSEMEKELIMRKVTNEESKKAFREYAKKYYSKKQAKQMIKEREEKMKWGQI